MNFQKNRSISKRKAIKIESDRGKQFYNSIFQNFMILKTIQHYSRYTDKRSLLTRQSHEKDT